MHHYEEDLLRFVKQDSKERKRYKEFKNLYQEFLDLANISTDKIDNVITKEFLYYFNFEEGKEKLRNMLSYLESSDVNLSVNSIKSYFLECYHSNYVKGIMQGLTGAKDVIKVADFFYRHEKTSLLTTFLEIVKVVLYLAGKQLIALNDFKDKARKPFLKYYNNIVNKKVIPDELLKEITWYLSCDGYFSIQSDYVTNFISYTNKHNEKVKNVHEVKIAEDKPKEPTCKRPVIKIDGPAIKETDATEAQERKKLINNYVESYFAVLVGSDGFNNIESYLPPKSIYYYDEVLEGLLLKYEQYLDYEASVGNNTMDKMNIYMQLVNKVRTI